MLQINRKVRCIKAVYFKHYFFIMEFLIKILLLKAPLITTKSFIHLFRKMVR